MRDSSSEPASLEPGRSYALKISLHFTSWVFPSGHRVRLSVSNAQWPMMWPTPYSMATALKLGGGEHASRIELPVVPLNSPIAPPKFTALPVSVSGPPTDEWITERDQFHQSSKWIWRSTESSFDVPSGKVRRKHWIEFAVEDAHPESASSHGEGEVVVEAGKRLIAWKYVFDLRGDRTNFYYSYTRTLVENGNTVRTKTWQETLPRDYQ
jgi:hypothetical protein